MRSRSGKSAAALLVSGALLIFIGSCREQGGEGSPFDLQNSRKDVRASNHHVPDDAGDSTGTGSDGGDVWSDKPLWPQELPCRNDLETPTRDTPEQFHIPSSAEAKRPDPERLRSTLENNPRFDYANKYGFGPETKSDPSGFNGYETWRNDVSMYLDSLTGGEPPKDATFQLAILVNWQPVTFEYTRWLDERGGEKKTGETTHLDVSQNDPLQQLDITIPKEQFGEGRKRIGVYPISVFLRVSSQSDGQYGQISFRRHLLYYSDTSWPEVPCREKYPSSEWTEDEDRIISDSSRGGVIFIFPAEKRDSYMHGGQLDAEPGEEIPINMSITHVGGDGRPGGALVPFFGSKMAHKMWMYKDGIPAEEADGLIAYRRQFTVEAPEEPGVHNLFVGYWPDAYLPARTFDGQFIPGVKTLPGDRSNIIPVHVSE